jgi:hypothetical protein
MIAAPFVLGGITGAAMLSDVTVGVLVTLFAGYNSYVSSGTGADSGRSESTARSDTPGFSLSTPVGSRNARDSVRMTSSPTRLTSRSVPVSNHVPSRCGEPLT